MRCEAAFGLGDHQLVGLLGHSARGVTQGYVHLDCVAADRVSAEIAQLLEKYRGPQEHRDFGGRLSGQGVAGQHQVAGSGPDLDCEAGGIGHGAMTS